MALNIPTKKTGDQLTATEFNELISEITDLDARKMEVVPGKGLSSNDYTTGEKNKLSGLSNYDDSGLTSRLNSIEEQVSGTTGRIVSSTERKTGSFNLGGESHDTYERTFELVGLPKSPGTTGEFILSDEPLGHGLYFNVESFSVSAGKKIKSEFFLNLYEIVNVHVDDTLKTKVVIKCKESTVLNLKAVLRLTYCKFFGDKVTLEVTVPTGINPSLVDLTFPRLKYNKKLVFSWINDDSCSIWNNIFCLVNKKWVDDGKMSFWNSSDTREFFPHLNWSNNGVNKTTGFTPDKFLEYSDGAGVKHRFATSVATWSPKLGERDQDVGIFTPWNSAKETRLMSDFGFTVGYHDVIDYDGSSQENFNSGIEKEVHNFARLINRIPKCMIEPNGDHKYLDYGRKNPAIQFMIAQGGDGINFVYPHGSGFTMNKNEVTVKRVFVSSSNEAYISDMLSRLQSLHEASDLNTIYWLIGSGHRCSKELDSTLLQGIESAYGSSGDDSVWIPSVDEFFEYWFMTSLATVAKEVSGQKVKFTMYLPTAENFWFKSISCLLSGITSTGGITVLSSDNCTGESFCVNDGELLVNLDFNPGLLDKVERYVSKYESSESLSDKEDASYFVQLLKTELQGPYIERLNVNSEDLSLISIIINGGATSTTSRNVSVLPSYRGTPTHYRAGETSDLSSVAWVAYPGGVISSMLSTGYGSKTVYLQLKDASMETAVKQATIDYAEESTEVPLTGLSVSGESSVQTGKTLQLSVTYTPSNTTQTGVTWESSNPSLATVNGSGLVTGVTSGSVTITATSSLNPLVKATKNIIVNAVVTKKTVVIALSGGNNSTHEIDNGKTITLVNLNRYVNFNGVLKDTGGEIFGSMVKDPADYPDASSFRMTAAMNPSLSGNAGTYQDKYLNTYYYPDFPGTTEGVILFNLPNGTYDVHVYVSTSDKADVPSDKYSGIVYRCNNVDGILSFSPLNNNNNRVELVGVVVTNGTMELRCVNNTGMGYRGGLNLIEIISK